MYKYESGMFGIKKIEIIRETDKRVYVKTGSGERRRDKKCSYYSLFDSYADARDHQIKKAHEKMEAAEKHLEHCQGEHREALNIPLCEQSGQSV